MNFQPLRDFLDYYLQNLSVPGSDTIIYRNHEEIFRYQSGFDDIRYRTPVKPDAMYNIYSCSKVATGVAATQLIERGEIAVTDPLYAYFPEFRDVEVEVRDDSGNIIGTRRAEKPILIKHLLTMTSGMYYNWGHPAITDAVERSGGRAPTLDICRAAANVPLAFTPGEGYKYGFSLDIMAGVIELVTGTRFADYMHDNIFEPLEMKDTSYHIPKEKAGRMATQYEYDSARRSAVIIDSAANAHRLGCEFDSGGAGIISTVSDYILLADALACGGVGKNGSRILSSYGVRLMSSNSLNGEQLDGFMSDWNTGYGYGYGVRVNMNPTEIGNIAPVGEFGWDGAKLCYFSADPVGKISVFHAEHMGGVHGIVIPRLRNLIYSCIGE